MFKRRVPRFVALIATFAAAASLVGMAIGATGAYFTDNHSGAITGTFGAVSVNVSGDGTGTDGLQFVLHDLMPGEFKTMNVSVTNTGTGDEDIYLVFDDANGEWSAINTLGTYGEFIINGTDYNNLNNHYPQDTAGSYTNACGDTVSSIRYLPHVNGLARLAPLATQTFVVQFRYSACISNSAYQLQPAFAAPLVFAIAAEQPNVLPNDPHNGAGRIPDLTLAPGWYQ